MYDRYILFYYSIDQQTNRKGLHTKYHTLLCPRMTHTFYRTFRKLLTDIRNTGTSLLGNINLLLALYCSLLGSPPPPAGRMLKVIVFSKHGSFVLQTNSSSFMEKKGNGTKLQNKQPPPLKNSDPPKGSLFLSAASFYFSRTKQLGRPYCRVHDFFPCTVLDICAF